MSFTEEIKVQGKELLEKVENLIHEGNIRRIIIKDSKGNVFIEIPVAIGILGVIVAPVLAAVGALAGMAAQFTIEIIRKEDREDRMIDDGIKSADYEEVD